MTTVKIARWAVGETKDKEFCLSRFKLSELNQSGWWTLIWFFKSEFLKKLAEQRWQFLVLIPVWTIIIWFFKCCLWPKELRMCHLGQREWYPCCLHAHCCMHVHAFMHVLNYVFTNSCIYVCTNACQAKPGEMKSNNVIQWRLEKQWSLICRYTLKWVCHPASICLSISRFQ